MKFTFHVSRSKWAKWTLLAALALAAKYGTAQSAVLLHEARVSRDTIRLSDLLPPEAPAATRRAGDQIELGRTPQCHSIRMFEASEIERRISSWPALERITFTGPVSVQRTCFPIQREAIQRVISEFAERQAMDLPELSPHWSESIFAAKENPALEVEKALPIPSARNCKFVCAVWNAQFVPAFGCLFPPGRGRRFFPWPHPGSSLRQALLS